MDRRLADSNPGSWLEAKIAMWEAAGRDAEDELRPALSLEAFFESEQLERQLRETRVRIGFLRECISTCADTARGLRAQAAEPSTPVLPMIVTTRRRPR